MFGGLFKAFSGGFSFFFPRSFMRRQIRTLVERAREFKPFKKSPEKIRDERLAAEIARRARPKTEFVQVPTAPAPVALSATGGSSPAASMPSSELVPGADGSEVRVVVKKPSVAAPEAVTAADAARVRELLGRNGKA